MITTRLLIDLRKFPVSRNGVGFLALWLLFVCTACTQPVVNELGTVRKPISTSIIIEACAGSDQSYQETTQVDYTLVVEAGSVSGVDVSVSAIKTQLGAYYEENRGITVGGSFQKKIEIPVVAPAGYIVTVNIQRWEDWLNGQIIDQKTGAILATYQLRTDIGVDVLSTSERSCP